MYSFADFLALGRQKPAEPRPPNSDDLCTIMYTSGTTGPPKVIKFQLSLPKRLLEIILDHTEHKSVSQVDSGVESLSERIGDTITESHS